MRVSYHEIDIGITQYVHHLFESQTLRNRDGHAALLLFRRVLCIVVHFVMVQEMPDQGCNLPCKSDHGLTGTTYLFLPFNQVPQAVGSGSYRRKGDFSEHPSCMDRFSFCDGPRTQGISRLGDPRD